MKLSFRWYGDDDKVTLEQIRQIPGMHSIVTAVYDVPVGEVWSNESIAKLKKETEDAGLADRKSTRLNSSHSTSSRMPSSA